MVVWEEMLTEKYNTFIFVTHSNFPVAKTLPSDTHTALFFTKQIGQGGGKGETD